MHKKEEALEHLSAIKSVLIDKDSFFPYNYNALIIWGLIGTIMTFTMPYLMKHSIIEGTLFSIAMMSIGFFIEGLLTKRVNENYDIETCTKKQRFIASSFTILATFAIIFSAFFAKQDLIVPLFMIWMFTCGFGHYVVGYVLNIRLFTVMGYISIVTALILFIVSIFMIDLGDINSLFFYICQVITFVVLGILPIWMGRKLKKEL